MPRGHIQIRLVMTAQSVHSVTSVASRLLARDILPGSQRRERALANRMPEASYFGRVIANEQCVFADVERRECAEFPLPHPPLTSGSQQLMGNHANGIRAATVCGLKLEVADDDLDEVTHFLPNKCSASGWVSFAMT